MISNLLISTSAIVNRTAQVCLVGAGTAGLFLGKLLRERGVDVILLEAGSLVSRDAADMGQQVEQRGTFYRGAELGRRFGLGGTSVAWGGQMMPMVETDFAPLPEIGQRTWPITRAELDAHYAEVKAQLGLLDVDLQDHADMDGYLRDKYPDLHQIDQRLELRLSEWLPFSRRNFSVLFAKTINEDDGLEIWLNAAVTNMSRSVNDGCARIDQVTARSPNGRTLNVQADMVVICAGALESTRLLLEFDESSNGSITKDGAPLGRYLGDHLSVTCANVVCQDWHRYNLSVAPIFENRVMRSPRIELKAPARKEAGLASGFAQLAFRTSGNTGFDLARKALMGRKILAGSMLLNPGNLGRIAKDLGAMGYWREAHRRLWIPRDAQLFLQVDCAQVPNAESRLYLSGEKDELSRKRLIVDWRLSEIDIVSIRKIAEITVEALQHSALARFATFQLTVDDTLDTFGNQYDVYHPIGTLRMGASPASSVVNKDLRLWQTDNCYVTTTAVFPTLGSANPGLTHLALTDRLAGEITKRLLG